MAQNTTPTTGPESSEETESNFHYYSGGEVKEFANTTVSPLLWVFWSVVIVCAVGYLIFGGALGPKFGGFKPVGGSAPSLAAVQTTLNQQAYGGGETAQQADMMQLLPHIQYYSPSETLDSAVSNGQNTYQNYCIGCHGPNQDGNGPNASSLNPKPRNLRDAPFMRETMNYQRINYSLHYGVHGTAMPRWENTLSEPEIQDVIAYVLSLSWTMPSANMQPTATLVHPNGVPINKNASGGSTVHGNSIQTSPKPITPAIGGNPAAPTSTSPPSASGQPTAVKPIRTDVNTPETGSQTMGGQNTASPSAQGSAQPANPVAGAPVKPTAPDTGGASTTPPFSPGNPASH